MQAPTVTTVVEVEPSTVEATTISEEVEVDTPSPIWKSRSCLCHRADGLKDDHTSQEILAIRNREPKMAAAICTFSITVKEMACHCRKTQTTIPTALPVTPAAHLKWVLGADGNDLIFVVAELAGPGSSLTDPFDEAGMSSEELLQPRRAAESSAASTQHGRSPADVPVAPAAGGAIWSPAC
ncbi:hypothetical protein EYF80_005159 [Liparis tanakae]|uniref:Uncharacterized protein n=1 Tax=Liparis tanakae TaxID=230148 RepID=A0A4Z2J2K9_9TELE|nr:hypothetical protein EYF80_005159 [Liparis tanakae]